VTPLPPTTPAPLTVAQGATAGRVAEALRDLVVPRAELGGSVPNHPAELIAYHLAVPGQFIAHASATTDESMRVGGQTVRDLDLAAPGQRLDGFRTAIARESLAEGDTPAWRRLGDVVLPDLRSATIDQARRAGLWVLVMSPDPGANGERALAADVVVVGVEGAAEVIPGEAVAARLEQQNAARRTLGLPDLTDPRAVEQGGPPARLPPGARNRTRNAKRAPRWGPPEGERLGCRPARRGRGRTQARMPEIGL
jgi:hypothetical protein